MPKPISIDSHAIDGIKQAALNVKDRMVWYFTSITQFQQYAWMAAGAGVLFVVVALIMW